MSERAAPNPKIRGAAVVLLLVAVLALLGAVTGVNTHGSPGMRIAFGVAGVLLLAPGLLLVRSRVPALRTVRLDERGLVVAVAGAPEDLVPWNRMRAVGIRRFGAGPRAERAGLSAPGLLLSVDLAATDVPHRLHALQLPLGGGIVRLVLGLTRAQATALRRQIPAYERQISAPPTTDHQR